MDGIARAYWMGGWVDARIILDEYGLKRSIAPLTATNGIPVIQFIIHSKTCNVCMYNEH